MQCSWPWRDVESRRPRTGLTSPIGPSPWAAWRSLAARPWCGSGAEIVPQRYTVLKSCEAWRDALPCRPSVSWRAWSRWCPSCAVGTRAKVMAQRLLMIGGLASVFAFGIPNPSTGHDWYTGLTNSAGVACCGSAECRPAAARYNQRTGSWETEVIKDTWLPVSRVRICRNDPLFLSAGTGQTRSARGWLPSFVHVLGGRPSA
jgi:hypothetical protein